MCTANLIVNGQYISCRNCWQCRSNFINEKLGRCLAEAETSVATYTVTLTYREQGTGDRPYLFNKKDIQNFMKAMRNKYGKIRYLISGERGELKGRVHWHAILFFQEQDPKMPLDQNQIIKPWPWGHTFWQKAQVSSLHYALKYAVKQIDEQDRSEQVVLMSKQPPLGHYFFQKYARDLAQNGVKPRDFTYTFPDVKDTKGRKKKFMMFRQTRNNFMDTYIEEYINKWGFEPWCDLYEEYTMDMPDGELEFTPSFHHTRYYTPTMNIKDFDWSKSAWMKTHVYQATYQGIPIIIVKDPNEPTSTITSEYETWHADAGQTQRILQDCKISERKTLEELYHEKQLNLG